MDLATITRKARYGHKAIVYWYEGGTLHHRPYGRAGIKAAILATGFRGRWYLMDRHGVSTIVTTFRFAIHLWRCAPAS
jgi:hypothetical protein